MTVFLWFLLGLLTTIVVSMVCTTWIMARLPLPNATRMLHATSGRNGGELNSVYDKRNERWRYEVCLQCREPIDSVYYVCDACDDNKGMTLCPVCENDATVHDLHHISRKCYTRARL